MENKFFILLILFLTILLAGCLLNNPGSGTPHQRFQNVTSYTLTPEMRSQAIAIALNNSEIKNYSEDQIYFEIQGVETGGFSEVSFGRELQVFCPVVRIKTKTAYLTLYINLEKQETYFIDRLYIREAYAPQNAS